MTGKGPTVGAADHYDDLVNHASRPPETAAEVAGLSALARGGRALELGVGTGRVAIPLAASGIEVHGIDLDPRMLELLHEKPGGDRVITHLADMADVPADGPFDVVFAVFGTFFSLDTQHEQVRCFANVAQRLRTDGVFLIEALMPRPASFDQNAKVTVADATDDRVILNVTQNDPLAQTIDTRQLSITATGTTIHPIHIRYSWPSELDLMAQLAGMRLAQRWSEWDGTPFTSSDQRHISLYELA